jgi:hypothetical protein
MKDFIERHATDIEIAVLLVFCWVFVGLLLLTL